MNQPEAVPAREARKEGPLDLAAVLDDLVAEGYVRPEQAAALKVRVPGRDEPRHPLARIAACEWENAREPGRRLTLEAMVQWLAAKAALPYLRIDPLSIEVARVTAVDMTLEVKVCCKPMACPISCTTVR